MLIQNLTHDRPLPKQIGLLTFRDIRFLYLRSVQSIANYSVLTQAVLRINLVKMSRSQVFIFIISSLYYLENFNADVAIMIKMWDIDQRVTKLGVAQRVSSELCVAKIRRKINIDSLLFTHTLELFQALKLPRKGIFVVGTHG